MAKLLENYGKRVQYSVFEIDIPEKKYRKLYGELLNEMDGEKIGNIRIYRLCANCIGNITVIGIPDIENKNKNTIII